jgi:hypothetical protein
MAAVGTSSLKEAPSTMAGAESATLVQAAFAGLAQGGATRHVVAAAMAALVRLLLPAGRGHGLDDTEWVEVPMEVAAKIRPVAGAMAVQGIVGSLLGQPLHCTGQAYQALRVSEPALATQVKALNRVANIAKHGTRRGGKQRGGQRDDAPAVDTFGHDMVKGLDTGSDFVGRAGVHGDSACRPAPRSEATLEGVAGAGAVVAQSAPRRPAPRSEATREGVAGAGAVAAAAADSRSKQEVEAEKNAEHQALRAKEVEAELKKQAELKAKQVEQQIAEEVLLQENKKKAREEARLEKAMVAKVLAESLVAEAKFVADAVLARGAKEAIQLQELAASPGSGMRTGQQHFDAKVLADKKVADAKIVALHIVTAARKLAGEVAEKAAALAKEV